MKPLELPEHLRGPSRLARIIGWTEWRRRGRKLLVEQLRARTEDVGALWGSSARAEIAAPVCEVIARELGWPNHHFIPDDPISLIFIDDADGMSAVEVALGIECALRANLRDVIFADPPPETLGELVDRLLAARKRGEWQLIHPWRWFGRARRKFRR